MHCRASVSSSASRKVAVTARIGRSAPWWAARAAISTGRMGPGALRSSVVTPSVRASRTASATTGSVIRVSTRPASFTSCPTSRVVLPLGYIQSVGEQGLDGVRGPVDREREVLAFGRGELVQHEVGRVLPARWTTHPELDPIVLTGTQRLAERLEPVVAVVAAAELGPQGAEVEIQLVVDHHQRGRLDLEELQQPGDRAARLVHVGARL